MNDVSGVRRVLRNGTLVLLPFPAAAYRQDVHSAAYRCVASNTVGKVLSRDVQVRAGKRNLREIFIRFTTSQYRQVLKVLLEKKKHFKSQISNDTK